MTDSNRGIVAPIENLSDSIPRGLEAWRLDS